LILDTALDGHGLAYLPLYQVQQHLSRPPANGRGMDYVPGIRAAEAKYGGKIEADG
jgi:hypothetical protein